MDILHNQVWNLGHRSDTEFDPGCSFVPKIFTMCQILCSFPCSPGAYFLFNTFQKSGYQESKSVLRELLQVGFISLSKMVSFRGIHSRKSLLLLLTSLFFSTLRFYGICMQRGSAIDLPRSLLVFQVQQMLCKLLTWEWSQTELLMFRGLRTTRCWASRTS